MFTQKKGFLGVWCLSVVFLVLVTVSASALVAPSDAQLMAFAGSSSYGSGLFDLHSVPQVAKAATGTNGDGFSNHIASDPTPANAVNAAAVHNNVAGQDLMPGLTTNEVSKVGADPSSADNDLPPTMTVGTAALLELHAMRKSAVALCIQLPTKFRTRLPQCADIFKHEIRLTEIVKHRSQ